MSPDSIPVNHLEIWSRHNRGVLFVLLLAGRKKRLKFGHKFFFLLLLLRGLDEK